MAIEDPLAGATPRHAVVIMPGDKVLLTFGRDDLSREQVAEMRVTLASRFPDVEFTFVNGVTGVAVEES